MKILPVLFFLIITCATNTCSSQPVINDSSYTINERDKPAQENFEHNLDHHLFEKKRTLDFRFTTNTYCYLLLKISSSKLAPGFLLVIDNTSLDTVLIYHVDNTTGQKKLLYTGGNLVKYDIKRAYVWHTAPLQIDTATQYYLIAIKALSKNVALDYKIIREGELARLYKSFDRLIFFYLGLISLITFTCLAAFFLFRNKGLVIYSCYIIAATLWILSHYGYLYPAIYPSFPVLNQIIKLVSSLAAIYFFLALISFLFKTELKKTFIYKLLYASKRLNQIIILSACLHLVFIFPGLAHNILNIAWQICVVLSIAVILLALLWLYKMNKTAKNFLSAIAIMSVMTIVQVLSNINIINSRFLNDHGMLLASLIEILIMTFGIFYKIWQEKIEKEQQLTVLEKEQKNAMQMLIHAQDNERKRIAGDLHDSIGPMLAAIKINFLRAMKAKAENIIAENLVSKTEAIIDDSITEIRNIAHQLMPKELSAKGLINLLDDYFNNLQPIYNITIRFIHSINSMPNSDMQLNIYRIICELVLNAAKYSGSGNITVAFKTSETQILIVVEDNGKGFDLSTAEGDSFGLKNVRSRVDYLKGILDIHSIQGAGTSVNISFPYGS